MKKTICLILTLILALSLSTAVFAVEETTAPVVREPFQCGEDMTWAYADGVLTITGTGAMDDFVDTAPWDTYREEITTVVLEGEITYIGARAFYDYDGLTSVDFGTALYEIGQGAFGSCGGLTVLELPESFKIFGEESLRGCGGLTEIHCAGAFPSFRSNCLWDTYVTIYFPAERPWAVEYIQQLEEAFKGRVEFLASDGTDPYVPTEATEEPVTEETTEATTEETTGMTAEPTQETLEATEAILPEETTEETAAQTQPEETAAEETVEPPEKEDTSGRWTGLIIVGVVLVILVLGFLLFAPKGGGKYRKRR